GPAGRGRGGGRGRPGGDLPPPAPRPGPPPPPRVRPRRPDPLGRDGGPSCGTVILLTVGYAAYWAVTGVAFATLVASLYPLAATDVPVVVAAYAAAYAVGFLALLTPAGLGVREGILVIPLAR